ncbi:hypothetical protein [Halorubellus sp. JP-L1]|uniref:hypothetical protein n=1 Tax=Halorubellus sp. JP-L1 TaxID=2715753 RepID=UPI0019657E63|nr:hypothetical protein [Halorubellus sp. JP-L1]
MSADDDGYVHRPGAARDTDADGDDATGPADDPGTGTTDSVDDDVQGAHPDAVDRGFDGRGWVLIGVLAFSLLGAPLLILWRPPVLPYWVALLALPMLPAILLGAVGVWATTRP